MKKLVLINEKFKDVYSKKIYKAGDTEEMTVERITEIKAVNPNFVTIIGDVKEEVVEEVVVQDGKGDGKEKK